MPTKSTKKAKGAQLTSPVKAKPVKVKEPESDSSEEESSSEDEVPVKAAPAKAVKPVPTKDSDDDSSDDDSDDMPNGKALNGKGAEKKKAVKKEESSEEESEDEKPATKAPAKPAAKVAAKKPAPKKESSNEESSSEEESEEEAPAKAPAKPAPKAAAKKPAAKEESSEEESSEEDSDEPAAKAPMKAAVQKKAAEESDDSDSDEESEEESEEEVAPVLTATISNAKGVTEKQLKKFFKSNGIKSKEIKQAGKKSFTVDFESAADTMKAVGLSGQEVGERALKIEAVSPANAAAKTEALTKKGTKRPAPADDEEAVSETRKRKKSDDDGATSKKQKLDETADGETITLFVGQLSKETTVETMKKFFKKNGVKMADVRKVDKKRFGYADLADPADLEKALALAGKEIDGESVTLERARPKTANDSLQKTPQQGGRKERDASADERTLFVKGLADSVDESKLQECFGEATEVRLPQKDGYHKGFAYIVFPDKDTAEKVMSEKQGVELEGSSLYLDYTGTKSNFKPRERSFNDSFGGRDDRRKSTGERGTSNTLFVKNLSFNLDEDSLRDAFPKATTARIAKFPDTQKPKGFGFVEFGSADDAAAAYDQMQNTEIEGRQVFLDFASPGGGRGGGRGGFGDRGGRGRGGFRGGRGGFGDRGGRGGRGGFGDRGGRGGRGGFRGGRGGGFGGEPQNKKMKFDSDSD